MTTSSSSMPDLVSDDEIESLKCATDVWYFSTEYAITVDDSGEEHKFPDWDYLCEFMYALEYEKRLVVLKSRQMLISWAVVIYAVWVMIFRPNQTILFISKKKPDAKELISRAWKIIDGLPSWLGSRPDTNRRSKERIDCANGSRIISLPCVPDSARSYTATLVFIDEAAYHADFNGVYQGAKPAVGRRGRMCIVSTPNPEPIGKPYKEFVLSAEAKRFRRMDIHFGLNPNKDHEWEMEERASMSAQQFKYEHELCLQSAGAGMIFYEFNDEFHIVDRIVISSDWKLYRTIDFGPRLACIWWAQDPFGNLWAYRELYINGLSTEKRCQLIKQRSGNERYEFSMSDEADPEARRNFALNGVPSMPSGKKDTLDSIFVIKKYLEGDRDTRPGLAIHQSLKTLIDEIHSYMGDDNGYPVRHQEDHGIDGSRYLIRRLDRILHDTSEGIEQYDENPESYADDHMVITGGAETPVDLSINQMEREFGIDESRFDASEFGI